MDRAGNQQVSKLPRDWLEYIAAQAETQHKHFVSRKKYRAEIHFAFESGDFTSYKEVHDTVDEFLGVIKYPDRWEIEHIQDDWVSCTFRTKSVSRIKAVRKILKALEFDDDRFDDWTICLESEDGTLEHAELSDSS